MAKKKLDIEALIRRLDEQQEESKQANLQRYEALLTHIANLGEQVGGTFGQAQQLQETIGTAARTRISELGVKAGAQAEQDLISRGLGSTTMRSSAKRGVTSDTQRALAEQGEKEAALKSGLIERRAGMETQIGGMKASAIEGRTDTGPDFSMYAALIQAAAAGEKADTSGGKAMITSGGGGLSGGIVTKHRAQQSAGGGGSGGGLSTGRGGAGVPPSGGPGSGRYSPPGSFGRGKPSIARTTGPSARQIAKNAGGLILSPQGPAAGVPCVSEEHVGYLVPGVLRTGTGPAGSLSRPL